MVTANNAGTSMIEILSRICSIKKGFTSQLKINVHF